MNFTNAVVDLSGAIPSTGDLTQWANDGVIDVLSRTKITDPGSLNLFAQEKTVADGGLTVANTTVLYVHRDSVNCRLVDGKDRHAVVDTASFAYATASDPVFFIHEAKLYVKPTSGTTVKASIVDPGEISDIAGTTAIAYFPTDRYNLVVMYAALQVLHHKMVVTTMPEDLSLETIVPLSLSTVVPTAPTAPVFSVLDAELQNTTGTITKSLSGTAPIYSTPSPNLSIESFDTFSGSFANLSISIAPPVAPATPSFSTPNITTVTLGPLASAPIYTPPAITNAADTSLGNDTDMDVTEFSTATWTDLDFDFDNENIDFLKWFQVVGDMIQNQEDVALASMQLQKIGSFLNAYNIAMQNKLNIFNDANTEYQTSVQTAIQNAQIAAQEAQTEGNLLFQKETSEYGSKLNKFQAEVQLYQQEINSQVSEFGQNIGKLMQTWSGEQQNELARFGVEMQNNLNHFNASSTEYQATIQRDMAELNSQLQADISKMSKSTDLDIQNKSQELQKQVTDYNSQISKYQAEVGSYQQQISAIVGENGQNLQRTAETNSSKIQDFGARVQKASGEYQWMTGQYATIKAQYEQSFIPR